MIGSAAVAFDSMLNTFATFVLVFMAVVVGVCALVTWRDWRKLKASGR